MSLDLDRKYLQMAIDQSRESVERGGFPVGAVLVGDGEVVASGLSNGKHLHDPTSHAEIVAIRQACDVFGRRNLRDCVLYCSLAPCLMCYGAAFWASIPRVAYACRKEQVSWQHSEGSYDLDGINQQTRRPIELVHLVDMERAALAIVQDWEGSKRP